MPTSHRRPDPDDERLFSPRVLPVLRAAALEIGWLLERGYPLEPGVSFVGSHHQLTSRQRLALRRSACAPGRCLRRRERCVPSYTLRGRTLSIDGFNLVIGVEVALGGGVVLRGADGALRDLAGLRGSYHLVAETLPALDAVGAWLAERGVAGARWYLDAPVSNSGLLRSAILERMAGHAFTTEVDIVPDPDRVLAGVERVVSGDGAVLDRCISWINAASEVVERVVPGAWIVDLPGDDGATGRS